MTQPNQDPLLATAGVLLFLFLGVLAFVLVMVGIGTVAALTIQQAEILEKVADAGLAPITYWGVIAALIGITAMLYLAVRFVNELRAIVDSVEEDDPFAAANADRLESMGWLAIAIKVIETPIRMSEDHLRKLTDQNFFELGGSSSGITLVITLFILARVFRHGARMREELEGTV